MTPNDDTGSEFESASEITRGAKVRVPTSQRNVFRLSADYMTISYMFDSAGAHGEEYPKYVLESTDGAYKKELSPKNDLKPGDEYLQLRFERLLPGKRYTLTRFHDAEHEVVLFDGEAFATIVDQHRNVHESLVDHGYGDYAVDGGSMVDIAPWEG